MDTKTKKKFIVFGIVLALTITIVISYIHTQTGVEMLPGPFDSNEEGVIYS